jgi:hypothetical protein
MNHDNSRLMYTEYENPSQPLRSQAEYHNAGAAPVRGDDASNFAHQQLAVNTAMAASVEWVNKLEENPDAKSAIDSAKGWNLKTHEMGIPLTQAAPIDCGLPLAFPEVGWTIR